MYSPCRPISLFSFFFISKFFLPPFLPSFFPWGVPRLATGRKRARPLESAFSEERAERASLFVEQSTMSDDETGRIVKYASFRATGRFPRRLPGWLPRWSGASRVERGFRDSWTISALTGMASMWSGAVSLASDSGFPALPILDAFL